MGTQNLNTPIYEERLKELQAGYLQAFGWSGFVEADGNEFTELALELQV